ncbi:MAG: ATP-grasp domain-containing protein, partial [Candidatus Heimdallarchaeaceae archaeon]
MKKLLFVGAGVYQLPGIRKANEEGFVTLAIDGDPKAIGLQEANLGKHLNILDKELCLKFAKEHEIDGVLTIASDVAVPTVAYIAEQMHLPGISTTIAEVSTNKYLQRQKMVEAGIKCPIFEIVGSEEELNDALNKFQYPVVIKPIDSAG